MKVFENINTFYVLRWLTITQQLIKYLMKYKIHLKQYNVVYTKKKEQSIYF